MDSFLQRHGQRILNNDKYAYLLASILMLIPFTSWISASIVDLVTLRKGYYAGFKMLSVVLLLALGVAFIFAVPMFTVATMLLTFVMSYLAAYVLRLTASWNGVCLFEFAIAFLSMLLIFWLKPDLVSVQYKELMNMLNQIGSATTVKEMVVSNDPLTQAIWANYTLGIRAFSILFSGLLPLVVARYVQSILYYPGGLKRELVAFQATRLSLGLLLIIAVGAYWKISLAVSSLPLLLAYLVLCGISFIYAVSHPKNKIFVIMILVVPLFIVPYIILPVFAILGLTDSVFNLRYYLTKKSDNREE